MQKICAGKDTPWPEERSTAALFTPIRLHASQHPAAVTQALQSSLRNRAVNHKFHYGTYKQARQWSALFAQYSPFINDPKCAQMYEQSYVRAAEQASSSLHVIGLGCGSGEKDLRLLQSLGHARQALRYTPVDVSVPLVVMAHIRAEYAGLDVSDAIVCDLLAPLALTDLAPKTAAGQRIITFFGMLPNFEPKAILPNFVAMLRPADFILLSANLAPGENYDAGVHSVLPQYDNPATEAWLLTFLSDLGVSREDGKLTWAIENDPCYPALRRLAAWFRFTRHQTIQADGEEFAFAPGAQIRLFFSYRYTVEQLQTILAEHGLTVRDRWATGEEAVLLCKRL